MITYTEFVNILENKNILLYDFQKRISYFRFNEMLKIKQPNLKMLGGGKSMHNNMIDNLHSYQLENIVFSLLNKDYETARQILK